MVPPEIDVVRTKYPLNASDIWALKRLPLEVGITKPVRHLQARSADEVDVDCGEPWLRNAEMISFTARRKNGRWFVDKSSIAKYEPVIVE